MHLHENWMRESVEELEHASQNGVAALIHALCRSFQADLFIASAELRTAARIDAELEHAPAGRGEPR